ncbi:hypothetical protein FHW84_001798 [Dyella sp. SG562]|uniref:hypothetical protein n=1 Tax=Dyella sp. SG562 TaxID=2587017 RepID=UPI0014215347|nr:hypothetical protein [Dyella sp. SG562]NII73229.1 hypothetical protein [Dyella sp. SG562]
MSEKDEPMPDKPKLPEPLVWESVPANDPLWEADVVPLPLPAAPEKEDSPR